MADRAALLALTRGRAIIRQEHVYFLGTVTSMTPVEADVPTIAVTEGLTLLYNPGWVKEQTDKQIAGALVHEVMHVVLRHFSRLQPEMDQKRWNVAGDLAINPQVLQERLELPKGALMPSMFGLQDGLTTEKYYDLLEDKKLPLGGEEGDGVCCGGCGSVSGQDHLTGEHDRTRAEVEQIAKEVKRALKAHAQKNPGRHWGLSAEELDADDSRVPWHRILRATISRQATRIVAGSTDWTRKRPGRRSFLVEYPLATPIHRALEVGVAIDTSGSMSMGRLKRALGEACGVFRAAGAADVWLLECDCRIATPPRRVALNSLQHARLHGGGGTSFDPVLREVETLRPRPQLLVYLTDGEGTASYRPRGVEVVWGVVGGFTEWLTKAGWQNVVAIEEGDDA